MYKKLLGLVVAFFTPTKIVHVQACMLNKPHSTELLFSGKVELFDYMDKLDTYVQMRLNELCLKYQVPKVILEKNLDRAQFKQKDISETIERLLHEESLTGQYCFKNKTITLLPRFYFIPHYEQAFCLWHEFRHHVQNCAGFGSAATARDKNQFYDQCVLEEINKNKKRLGPYPLDKMDEKVVYLSDYLDLEPSTKTTILDRYVARKSEDILFHPNEMDADLFAIKQFNCSVCLKILLIYQFSKDSSDLIKEGYIGKEVVEKRLNELNQLQVPYCALHQSLDVSTNLLKEVLDKKVYSDDDVNVIRTHVFSSTLDNFF